MEKYVWGQTPNGEDLIVYELIGEHGMKASVMNYGANLLSLFVPDKNGDTKDVVLGYEHFEDYLPMMLSSDAVLYLVATVLEMLGSP